MTPLQWPGRQLPSRRFFHPPAPTMQVVCLDLEGVLIPEIWIAFAERTGIADFRRTTRDEPDYDKLMRWRLGLLRQHGLKLADIQAVIGGMAPMDGAVVCCSGGCGTASDFQTLAQFIMVCSELP